MPLSFSSMALYSSVKTVDGSTGSDEVLESSVEAVSSASSFDVEPLLPLVIGRSSLSAFSILAWES